MWKEQVEEEAVSVRVVPSSYFPSPALRISVVPYISVTPYLYSVVPYISGAPYTRVVPSGLLSSGLLSSSLLHYV